MHHQINSQLSPRPARRTSRAGLGTATAFSVSWYNPSGVWQSIYNGPDEPTARAQSAEYETRGYAVDAWVYDDQLGWQLQNWSTASTGVTDVLPPKPKPPSTTPWGFYALGAGAVVFAAVGAVALSSK